MLKPVGRFVVVLVVLSSVAVCGAQVCNLKVLTDASRSI